MGSNVIFRIFFHILLSIVYQYNTGYRFYFSYFFLYILVLIGTSDFSNMLLKEITMGSLAVLSVAMIALRFIHMRQEANSPKDEEYEY